MAFFLRTVLEGSNIRLRPLSNQTFEDGTSINSGYNVITEKIMREKFPIGTVFACDTLQIHESVKYRASRPYPLVPDEEVTDAAYRCPPHLREAYDKYVFINGGVTIDTFFATPSSYFDKLRNNPDHAVPTAEDGFHVEPTSWYLLLRNILNQKNTMLVGQSGTGKTELVMKACKQIGVPCYVYDMGAMLDPVSSLLGVHRLKKGGESVFDFAEFVQNVQKKCVILLDEISRAPLSANNILFPCLDSRRELQINIAGDSDGRRIPIHEECTFVATANVGSEYTGTNQMDRALVSRFIPIEVLPLDVETETTVMEKRAGISPQDAKVIADVASRIREQYNEQNISNFVSTRECLSVAELVKDGMPPHMAMEMIFLPMFEGTKKDGERSTVAKIMMSL